LTEVVGRIASAMGEQAVSRVEQPLRRKRKGKAIPVLGAAGLSLSLASAAVAATGGPAPETIVQKAAVAHEVTLIEEEIGGASLATFYVFDKENAKPTRTGGRLAMSGGCSGCAGGGCLGAGGWHGDYSAGYNQAPPLLNEVDVPPRHWKKPGRHAHHKIHE
jgi:hypothetical protein